MPQDKIDDVAFVTPDRVILRFEPATGKDPEMGQLTRYEHIPAQRDLAAGWLVDHGQWYVIGGELTLLNTKSSEWHLRVLNASSAHLRLDGFPSIPCRSELGCELLPLREVPTDL
jgi:hypothetical protein